MAAGKMRYLLPLGVFLALALVLYIGLKLDPRLVPSPLIDKPAPTFELPRLHEPNERLATAELKGKVWLLNVWASWCVACRQEHEALKYLATKDGVVLIGLNYKDQRGDALQWLVRLGDPYSFSVVDADGRVGIDWGVYGVPETFVIDSGGVIRYKHIGPVTEEVIDQTILPLIRQLSGAKA